jgi:SAM-dependent methyltransferase
MPEEPAYIPALGHARLTPLYDPLMKWVMQEERFKRALVEQMAVADHQSVLDLGCGTGTLTQMLKQRYPSANLIGLDGDASILEIARAKAQRARAAIEFAQGMAYALPFADASLDRVVSSLMFHHLTLEDKERTAREMRRVLKPNGAVYIADLGKPDNWLVAIPGLVIGRLEHAVENLQGRLPQIFGQAGFGSVSETASVNTIIGTVRILRIHT